MTTNKSLNVEGIGNVEVTYETIGEGSPYLLLHGGAGMRTVIGFASKLASDGKSKVVIPTHPGFDATPRPESLNSIDRLASVYIELLDRLDLNDVTIIGNSVGGWIAADMALLRSPRITRVVLIDAGGLDIKEHPVLDIFTLPPDKISEYSFYNPDAGRIDITKMSDEQKAIMASNRATLQVYGGESMMDSELLARLPEIQTPTLIVWGAADRVMPIQHGQAFVKGIPGAKYKLIQHAGHLPQLEEPDELLDAIRDFYI
jgi:pimeloyl-ACP methyl ester carboxylesterase